MLKKPQCRWKDFSSHNEKWEKNKWKILQVQWAMHLGFQHTHLKNQNKIASLRRFTTLAGEFWLKEMIQWKMSSGKNNIWPFFPEQQTQWINRLKTQPPSVWRKEQNGAEVTSDEMMIVKHTLQQIFVCRKIFRNFRYSFGSNRNSLYLIHAVCTALRQCSEVLELQNYQPSSKRLWIFLSFRPGKP